MVHYNDRLSLIQSDQLSEWWTGAHWAQSEYIAWNENIRLLDESLGQF